MTAERKETTALCEVWARINPGGVPPWIKCDDAMN
jgi:hypothetical protein